MDSLILAAGFGTRLSEVAQGRHKSLLEVGNKSILERILDKVQEVKEVNKIYIITNNAFYRDICDCVSQYDNRKRIAVLNNGVNGNEDRKGAVGDIRYAITYAGIRDDLLIIGGDNLFDFSLNDFVDHFHRNGKKIAVALFDLNDLEKAKRFGEGHEFVIQI